MRLLTQAYVDSLQPQAERYESDSDTKAPGLRLIVQPTGHRSWALRASLNGKKIKATLGDYPAISLADARKKARRAKTQVDEGVDPAAEKRAARVAAKAKATEAAKPLDLVEDVARRFVETYAKRQTRERSWRETQRLLNHDVLPVWGKKRLSAITKADVHQLIDDIEARPAPVLARRALAALKTMATWAENRSIIATNVFASIRREGKAAPSRTRVLSDAEIGALLAALKDEDYPVAPMIRMLLLTGARRSEIAEMAWSEIDFAAGTWTLPGSRAKNHHSNTLPLPADALDILRKLPRFESSGWVFSYTGDKPVREFVDLKRRLSGRMSALLGHTVEFWVLHDLRRTMATGLQRLGVRLEVTEALLNHVGGSREGIVGVYQVHDYGQEKMAALAAWAERLAEIEAGVERPSNVVTFTKAV